MATTHHFYPGYQPGHPDCNMFTLEKDFQLPESPEGLRTCSQGIIAVKCF
jgi:hypothetical protein